MELEREPDWKGRRPEPKSRGCNGCGNLRASILAEVSGRVLDRNRRGRNRPCTQARNGRETPVAWGQAAMPLQSAPPSTLVH